MIIKWENMPFWLILSTMNIRTFINATLFIALIAVFAVSGQDKPDGFAAIAGKNLSGTTGGAGGQKVTVSTLADLQKYAGAALPYVILVKGTINAMPKGTNINVASNKTIVGLGADATIYQGELHLINVNNVIIRNLTIRDSYVDGDYDGKTEDWDAIQVDSSHHIWIDHCLLTHNCDGLIDLRKACDYVTVSWVHFSNHNKAFGIGWTTETDFRTTIHHCWFDSTNQRNPSFDMGIGHLYNNFIDKVTSYGNYSRGKARLVIENSVFSGVSNPLVVDTAAKLFVSGCQITNCKGTQSGNAATAPFTPKTFYRYTLDETSQVKSIVTSGAGPKAAIGDQYLGSPVTDAVFRQTPAQPVLKVSAQGNALNIGVVSDNRFSVMVVASNGRTIGRFERLKSSSIQCRTPAKGLYIVALFNENERFSTQQIHAMTQ